MIILKKRDIKKALKAGGKAGGSSYADIRTDIEATIDEAMTSTDPEVQANFRKLFRNKRPIYCRKGGASMSNQSWVLCPICNNKTRIKIRDDTELINFPLFCPKCKQETLINIKHGNIIIREPDAKTQSR